MIAKKMIIAHDNHFNTEACGRFAHYFSKSADVSDLVTAIEQNQEGPSHHRRNAYERTAAYSWEHVAEEYHKLFKGDSEVARARFETEARVSRKSQL